MNNTDKAEESCGIERMPKAYGVKQLSSMNFGKRSIGGTLVDLPIFLDN